MPKNLLILVIANSMHPKDYRNSLLDVGGELFGFKAKYWEMEWIRLLLSLQGHRTIKGSVMPR
jgi:hypothetical protein